MYFKLRNSANPSNFEKRKGILIKTLQINSAETPHSRKYRKTIFIIKLRTIYFIFFLLYYLYLCYFLFILIVKFIYL